MVYLVLQREIYLIFLRDLIKNKKFFERELMSDKKKSQIFFCRKCAYPSSAVSLDFDKETVCTGCQVTAEKKDIVEKKENSY